MKRTVMMKALLSLFIAVTFAFFINFVGFYDVKGYDYQESSAWTGADIGFTPQSDVNYSSNYVPFSMISSGSGTIDLSKTYVIESAYDLYMFSELSRGVHRTTY